MSEQTQTNRPEDKPFQQQRLKAWQPLLTPSWVIGTFLIVGLIFLPIGIVVLLASRGVVEVEYRYDVASACNTTTNANCNVTFTVTIPQDMKAPVYVYYKLTNFYQNHRRYVKSRSDAQLRGDLSGDISTCDPLDKWDGKTLYPCGLIANSFFNDTIYPATVCRNNICSDIRAFGDNNWNGKGIAWKSDLDEKFKLPSTPVDTTQFTNVGPNGALPSVVNEDFVVWMRTAGLPTFRKLYRKIENADLKAGDQLQMTVTSVFQVSQFGGEKSVVLSTTSWLGGKNDFLGIAYIVVGCICLALAALFGVKHIFHPRPLGDLSYFTRGAKAAAA